MLQHVEGGDRSRFWERSGVFLWGVGDSSRRTFSHLDVQKESRGNSTVNKHFLYTSKDDVLKDARLIPMNEGYHKLNKKIRRERI